MTYINEDSGKKECPFCESLKYADAFDSLVVYVGATQYLIMNLFPYNTGHLLVVPKSHLASIEELSPTERSEMFELANLAVEALRNAMNADGFNLGMNIGPVSGAGIAEHAHLHVVPRWFGDTNFMPLLANVKVLPEQLLVSKAKIKAEIDSILSKHNKSLRPAAGAIVYDKEASAIVLRKTVNNELVIPKGKIESGESVAEAAMREVLEETGYQSQIAGWAGRETIDVSSAYQLDVTYFLATGVPGNTTAEHLATDTVLVPVDESLAKLTFENQRNILERVLPLINSL